MEIAIIGTGRMATGLGRGWARAGHRVSLASRAPADHRDLAAGLEVRSHREALENADVVVVAIPFDAVDGFVREHADRLRDRVVVDITNPFRSLPENRSAAEYTARAIGPGARVVAAFKDNFWKTLSEPIGSDGVQRDVHYAGDDAGAKEAVARLVGDLGFQPVDCGDLMASRTLDAMVPLLVEMDRRLNGGKMSSSWKFVVP